MIFPERRSSGRYLTLKNAAITGITIVVAFLLLSTWSEFRPAHSGAPGVLSDSVPSPDPASAPGEPPSIVQEGSIYDHTGTDSILVDARTTPPADPAIATSTSAAEQKNFEHRESQLGKGQRITISGGSEGVQMRVERVAPPTSTQNSEVGAAAKTGQPARTQ